MSLIVSKDEISPAVKKLMAVVGDTRPVMEAAGLYVVSRTMRTFNDPSLRVKEWKPLHPRTIKAKKKAKKSTAILKRDVVLARSWRAINIKPDSVEIGTDRKYAATHQFGFADGGIPARPMLPFINKKLAPSVGPKLTAVMQRKLNALLRAKLQQDGK